MICNQCLLKMHSYCFCDEPIKPEDPVSCDYFSDKLGRSFDYNLGFIHGFTHCNDLKKKPQIEKIEKRDKALSNKPQGEWVIDHWGIYHCNHCMKEKQQLFHNFCGNCGADMRGEEND